MSSTEAELYALAACAIELIHIKGVLEFLGYVLDGPIEVETDNKGAFDLCHRYSAGASSKHIERKVYKMRELRGGGFVEMEHIKGTANYADMFTKSLPRRAFEDYRAECMNTTARPAGS